MWHPSWCTAVPSRASKEADRDLLRLLLPLNKHRLTSSVAWQSLFVCWLHDSNLLRCTEANCLLLGQPPLHTDEATWNEQFIVLYIFGKSVCGLRGLNCQKVSKGGNYSDALVQSDPSSSWPPWFPCIPNQKKRRLTGNCGIIRGSTNNGFVPTFTFASYYPINVVP